MTGSSCLQPTRKCPAHSRPQQPRETALPSHGWWSTAGPTPTIPGGAEGPPTLGKLAIYTLKHLSTQLNTGFPQVSFQSHLTFDPFYSQGAPTQLILDLLHSKMCVIDQISRASVISGQLLEIVFTPSHDSSSLAPSPATLLLLFTKQLTRLVTFNSQNHSERNS